MHRYYLHRTIFLILGLTVLVPSFLRAQSITGGQLLEACEVALKTRFAGETGMACQWYVTPCDCNYSDEILPRVCLPVKVDPADLAGEVIAGLKSRPELMSEKAAFAANSILSRLYPCSD